MRKPSDSNLSPVFFESYRQCRAAFLQNAQEAGAALQSFVHPQLKGREGEDLAIDVALMGVATAKRLLVMSSGAHGYEGFAGSAVQLDCLSRMSPVVAASPDVAILLIHGVNPFGWSHFSRNNENNVDLNRNFVEFSKPPEEHPLAKDIQAVNHFSLVTGPDFDRISSGLKALSDIHGASSVSEAVQKGQYFQPDGVGYGGDAPQWSNETLRKIWSQYFRGRDLVCLIDWHTGLGTYGEPVFLCFDPPASNNYRLASAWWGPAALSAADASYNTGVRPNYSGLMVVAAQKAAKALGATSIAAVIEFGTGKISEAGRCLWIDRWLRHPPTDANPLSVQTLQQRARRFFYPDEEGWKQKVLVNGQNIIYQSYRGLQTWSPVP